jgi:hypothetical protein
MTKQANNPTPGYVLVLTERQLWFLKCAIMAKEKILPLNPQQLQPHAFESDYGISQEDMKAEIANLSDKVKQLSP